MEAYELACTFASVLVFSREYGDVGDPSLVRAFGILLEFFELEEFQDTGINNLDNL